MELFEVIFPILAIAAIGYIVANRKMLSEAQCDAVSKFVFTIVVPSLFLINSATVEFSQDNIGAFLVAYYLPVLIIYLVSIFVSRLLFNYQAKQQSVFGMGASYSNAVMVGIPVCVYALREESLLPVFIIISLHNLSLFAFGIFVAERQTFSMSMLFQSIARVVKQLVTSPITGSLILGGLINLSNIPIYSPLEDTFRIIGSAALPCALFVLGASLNKYSLKGQAPQTFLLVGLKLIGLPFLVWLFAFHIFTIDPLWASVALLISAMPTAINSYIFSQNYKQCEAVITSGIFVSTVGSILTLTALIAYVRQVV